MRRSERAMGRWSGEAAETQVWLGYALECGYIYKRSITPSPLDRYRVRKDTPGIIYITAERKPNYKEQQQNQIYKSFRGCFPVITFLDKI